MYPKYATFQKPFSSLVKSMKATHSCICLPPHVIVQDEWMWPAQCVE